MKYITADEGMVARLRGVLEPIEIRDLDGSILGQFMPMVSPEKLERLARAAELFDLVEAERILATERHQGRPLAEIWRDIRSQENAK